MNKFKVGDTVVSYLGDRGKVIRCHRFYNGEGYSYYYSLDSTGVNFIERHLCLAENINNSNEFYINMMQDESI